MNNYHRPLCQTATIIAAFLIIATLPINAAEKSKGDGLLFTIFPDGAVSLLTTEDYEKHFGPIERKNESSVIILLPNGTFDLVDKATYEKRIPSPKLTAKETSSRSKPKTPSMTTEEMHKRSQKTFEDRKLAEIEKLYLHARALHIRQEYELATPLLIFSGELGNIEAQNYLAHAYQNGEGVPQNNSQAFHWFMLAAKQGNAAAQNNVGEKYRDGEGVTLAPAKAVEWFGKAAAQENHTAQYNLGTMYRNGHGVARDLATAEKWVSQAAASGNQDAREALAAVRRLTASPTPSSDTENRQPE